MSLITFEDKYGEISMREYAVRFPSSVGDRTLPIDEIAAGLAVAARVNHGRWCADCPTEGCAGATPVSFDNPVFFCRSCRNAEHGNKVIPVLLPDPTLRQQIEDALLVRPANRTRNWRPGEPVELLEAENRVNGL